MAVSEDRAAADVISEGSDVDRKMALVGLERLLSGRMRLWSGVAGEDDKEDGERASNRGSSESRSLSQLFTTSLNLQWDPRNRNSTASWR